MKAARTKQRKLTCKHIASAQPHNTCTSKQWSLTQYLCSLQNCV